MVSVETFNATTANYSYPPQIVIFTPNASRGCPNPHDYAEDAVILHTYMGYPSYPKIEDCIVVTDNN